MQLSRSIAQGTAPKATAWAPIRVARRRPRAFTGARKLQVQAAADSGEAAPAAEEPQQQRQRRAPKVVAVQMASIQPGQEYEGKVTKVEAFGAFVDIGTETNGLVHVSQLSDGYVKNVADVVKVGAVVKVKVLSIDPAQRRLALTMKGMGGAPASRGGRGAPAEASFDDEAEDEAEAFALEAGDVAYDGVVFRVDEDAFEADGYDEADEFEAEADAELAAIAALENSIVEGKVASVEDFGVVVEWTTPDGAKRSGLLHVSEMRAPAAAAEAELGAAAAAEAGEEGGIMADEGEYASEVYVDVGGIDKPSRYYKVGDAISCFVVGVEGGKVELTQDVEALALDDGVDEEGEAFDMEEERLLAQAEADEDAVIASMEVEEDDAAEEVTVTTAGDATAAVYYGQSNTAAKVAAAPAFIRGKAGAAVAPSGFPSRGYNVSDTDLRVAAANRLVDVDDAGDEAELVDYWTSDAGSVGKGQLAALGAKIVVGEEGEMEVVAREATEGAEAQDADVLELLAGISDADLDGLVDAILADDAEDEAEVPFNARRNPGSMA